MRVKILKPCLGHQVGAVVFIGNIGVAKTLISFGNCVEVKKDDDKLDSDTISSTKRVASKSQRSKVASKTKRKRHDSRQQPDDSDGSGSRAS